MSAASWGWVLMMVGIYGAIIWGIVELQLFLERWWERKEHK